MNKIIEKQFAFTLGIVIFISFSNSSYAVKNKLFPKIKQTTKNELKKYIIPMAGITSCQHILFKNFYRYKQNPRPIAPISLFSVGILVYIALKTYRQEILKRLPNE